MNSTDSRLDTRQRFPLVALLIGFAVLDFLAVPVVKLIGWQTLAILPLGLLGGQLGLLAIWAVLGPQHWMARQTVTFGLTLLFYVLFNAGSALSAEDDNSLGIWTALSAPLLLLAFQSPLWILRMAIGCRILHGPTETDASTKLSRQFRLSHLFGTMLVIAVAVALASLNKRGRDAWEETLLSCLLLATWSALSTLPCLWGALVVRDARIVTFFVLDYLLVATTLLLCTQSALSGRAPTPDAAGVVFLILAAPMGLMLAVLRLARKRGFRLMRSNSQHRAAGDDSPFGTGAAEPRDSSAG